MSTCPRRRTRPGASSSRALSCAPAPGHMLHHQKTRDARRQPCACLRSCSSSIISRNAHALRSYHALYTPVRQLHLLDRRLLCWFGGSDWRGLRDPRMHRLEHPFVLRAKDSPGGWRWQKVLTGAQEHAADRDAQPHLVSCASRKETPRRPGRCAAPHRWHHPADHVRHPAWPFVCISDLSIG